MKNDKLSVAIVHDFLIYQGGAERVLKEIADMFPKAPVFTLLSREKLVASLISNPVIPSFLNRISYFLPHRLFLPLYPIAAESIDLREYDLVISSTSSFMKGVVVKPRTLHLCYCHTPTSFLWDLNEQYLKDAAGDDFLAPGKRFLGRIFLNYLRMWDQTASKRVDVFLANSQFTASRIKKYYRRSAQVFYPPVDKEKFSLNLKKGKYFLVVSRLSAYKRIDLVIEAFNRLGWPLIIAGTGQEKRRLRKIARPNIRFVGFVNEKSLPRLYSGCRALIFPGEEDFGITMVEAMLSGKPVLAYGAGGALEIVKEGKTGEFFHASEVEILVDGLRRLVENEKNYSPEYIRKSAFRFSRGEFRRSFTEVIEKILFKK